jgi:hypothetical protein
MIVKPTIRNVCQNSLLLLSTVVFSLILLEIAYRVWMGVSPFNFTNFRANVAVGNLMGTVTYDADLGWSLIPNYSVEIGIPDTSIRHMINTIDYGIRTNGPTDNVLRTGGVLAVGDSFTAGSEVADADSWPAQLEAIIHRPVVNAGVGAYGSDQIVMRAEKLLPIVRPQVLLVGMLDQDILRAGYSNFGAPKPYYTLENGKLVLHNSPVPILEAGGTTSVAKTLAGYSLVVDQVMKTFDPVGWRGAKNQTFTRTGIDEVEATCQLLKGLKQKTDELEVRALLVMQYGGGHIAAAARRSDTAVQVEQCAEKMGYQIVDEFESLKAIADASPEEFRTYYRSRANGDFGHMSPAGNLHIAQLVAAALSAPSPPGRAADYVIGPFLPGDGRNLLSKSETLDKAVPSSSIASLQKSKSSPGDRQVFRVAATGPPGEHYLGLSVGELAAGPYMLSLDVRADGTSRLRIQLIDTQSNGAIGDYDLMKTSVGTSRAGTAHALRAGMKEIADGWYRLWLGATLPAGNTNILLVLSDANGRLNFTPQGEGYQVRAMQLERGQSPSSYRPTK